MKETTKKLLTWGIWVIILFILCGYFALDSTYDTQPLVYKFGKELFNIGLPYVFFTVFYVLAVTRKQYAKILYLILLDSICIGAIICSIYWFYEGRMLAVFSGILIIGFTVIKALVLILKKKSIKA